MAVPIPGDGPSLVLVPSSAWTKVAEGVSSGFIWVKETTTEYLQTWRPAGGGVPTDRDEGVALDQPGQAVNARGPIDIYIYAIDKNGEIRVDV
ncbi:MAG: hypothetical protein ACTSPB_05490 [Candidatus Thorarchaeota archaeon]